MSETTIYVDRLKNHDGKKWCHMFCADLAALEAFAEQIGVSSYRHYPPKGRWPHYDLTPAGRAKALAAGAVEASDRGHTIAIINMARRQHELRTLPLMAGLPA